MKFYPRDFLLLALLKKVPGTTVCLAVPSELSADDRASLANACVAPGVGSVFSENGAQLLLWLEPEL